MRECAPSFVPYSFVYAGALVWLFAMARLAHIKGYARLVGILAGALWIPGFIWLLTVEMVDSNEVSQLPDSWYPRPNLASSSEIQAAHLMRRGRWKMAVAFAFLGAWTATMASPFGGSPTVENGGFMLLTVFLCGYWITICLAGIDYASARGLPKRAGLLAGLFGNAIGVWIIALLPTRRPPASFPASGLDGGGPVATRSARPSSPREKPQ
jgi:hypothetical protein